jgi:twitching motility protein PilU
VEILMNTRHIADLIQMGELGGIKEAMEQSLAPGSQTFEQDLFHLYHENLISLEEALANADSPTNLHWLINNGDAESLRRQDSKTDVPTVPQFEQTQNNNDASFRSFTLNTDS